MKKKNITLIGMAGGGKSSVGKLLAETLKWKFVDTDKVMEEERGIALQAIVDELGEEDFKRLESSKIKELSALQEAVVSPGGSIVYSRDAMELLTDISTVVYLYADPKSIERRIDVKTRGIIGLKDKTFRQLFDEREILYKQFAHITVDCSQKKYSEIAAEILSVITQ